MESQVTSKLVINKLSECAQQLEDHNEFLELSTKFHSIQRNQYKSQPRIEQSTTKSRGSQPKIERGKALVGLNPSRSVRKILHDNLIRQKLMQQKIAHRQKQIQEEIILENKARELKVAQLKLKNRIAVEQRRLKRQNRSQQLKLVTQQSKSQSICVINPQHKLSNQGKPKGESISYDSQTIYSDKKLFKGNCSQITRPIRAAQSLKPIKQVKRINFNKKNDLKGFAKIREKDEIRRSRLLTENKLEAISFNKSQQLAKDKQKSMEKQLSVLYLKESKEYLGKAVQLASKIQNKYRLRLKNMNDKDYKQARHKLKLLSFFYSFDD